MNTEITDGILTFNVKIGHRTGVVAVTIAQTKNNRYKIHRVYTHSGEAWARNFNYQQH